jgi:hypothetical protein
MRRLNFLEAAAQASFAHTGAGEGESEVRIREREVDGEERLAGVILRRQHLDSVEPFIVRQH